jgi:predicted AAA+ superfamily ATPase
MYRFAIDELSAWKESGNKKPLMLRGARQVGKTWLVKEFACQQYQQLVYCNFDLDANHDSGKKLHSLFEGNLDPRRIISALESLFEMSIQPNDTLVFFDEIQEQPRAINALKYFSEQAPEYQIIAAGSNLGVAIHEGVSLPVGKVDFAYLYPMTFSEFLQGMGRSQLTRTLQAHDWTLVNAMHSELVDLLRIYLCVGGMPEVVQEYANNQNLASARKTQRDLLEFLRYDFAKHAPAKLLGRIWQVWDSIPVHLAQENKKFVWGALRPGARATDFEIALQWLTSYGVASKVSRITKPGMPLKAYEQENIFKLFMLDVGLLAAVSGLDSSAVLEQSRVFTEFKGSLAEQYVHQQLIARSEGGYYSSRPYYWTGKTAELDFVMQLGGEIVPIEVKSSENTRSRSLKSYIDRFAPKYAYRASLAPFIRQDGFTNIPLYAAEELPRLTH